MTRHQASAASAACAAAACAARRTLAEQKSTAGAAASAVSAARSSSSTPASHMCSTRAADTASTARLQCDVTHQPISRVRLARQAKRAPGVQPCAVARRHAQQARTADRPAAERPVPHGRKTCECGQACTTLQRHRAAALLQTGDDHDQHRAPRKPPGRNPMHDPRCLKRERKCDLGADGPFELSQPQCRTTAATPRATPRSELKRCCSAVASRRRCMSPSRAVAANIFRVLGYAPGAACERGAHRRAPLGARAY